MEIHTRASQLASLTAVLDMRESTDICSDCNTTTYENYYPYAVHSSHAFVPTPSLAVRNAPHDPIWPPNTPTQ